MQERGRWLDVLNWMQRKVEPAGVADDDRQSGFCWAVAGSKPK
jgi:hypothetical protein